LKNYDGSFWKKEYVVYYPNQIKLADGTNTTFDANNEDIRYEQGGNLGQQITCHNCGWQWNTKDSDEYDKYVCHKCGFDNSLFYSNDIMAKGGKINTPIKAIPITYTIEDYPDIEAAKNWLSEWQLNDWRKRKISEEQIQRNIQNAKNEIKILTERTPFTTWFLEIPKAKYEFEVSGATYEIKYEIKEVEVEIGWKRLKQKKYFWYVVKTNEVKTPFDEFIVKPSVKTESKSKLIYNINRNFLQLIRKNDIEKFPLPNKKMENGGLIAPNGKTSNLTPEQYKLVRTPEFKAWFGDWENDPQNASKVIDENGEPMVVYHGTTKDFTIFDIKFGGKQTKVDWGKLGFFFSPNKQLAEDFTRYNWSSPTSKIKKGSKVLATFLSIKNPYIISARKFTMTQETGSKERIKSIDNGYDGWIIEKMDNDGYESFSRLFGINSAKEFKDSQYAAFYPNQIKLADGTNTTFDINNSDIRYEQGGNLGQEITCHNCGWQWNTSDSNDSDKYVCHKCGFDNTLFYSNDIMGKGGQVPNKEFFKWYLNWYKNDANKNMSIIFSLPSELTKISSNSDSDIILDVFEKNNNNVNAKKYLQNITDNADKYGVTIYLKPIPRIHKIKSDEHKKKITKDYLIMYYNNFGFVEDKHDFMVRQPKISKSFESASNNQKWYRKYNGNDPFFYNKEARTKYGSGIYFSSQPNSRFDGEKEIEVLVDYKNPKIYENTKTIPNRNFTKDWRKDYGEDDMNKFVDGLFDSGYDAIIVKHSDTFGDELIIRNDSLIRYKKGGLVAPNGKPSNLTPEQYKLVRTPQFKAWFGDWENDPLRASKVVDENGEPLVVYHSTNKEFNVFDFNKADLGFHFGNYEQANRRSLIYKLRKDNTVFLPCFLNIRILYEINDVGDFQYPERYIDELIDIKLITEDEAEENDFYGFFKENNLNVRNFLLNKYKYDFGFIYENKIEGVGNSFIILKPNQIKLADGTNTTFDMKNPDIRFAEGGRTSKPAYSVVGIYPDKANDWRSESEDLNKEGLLGYRVRFNKDPEYGFGYTRFNPDELQEAQEVTERQNKWFEEQKENKKIKDAENKIKREQQKKENEIKLQAAQQEIIKKPAYLMEESEYQIKVVPLLKEYEKFVKKNDQYLASIDYDSFIYITFEDVLKKNLEGKKVGYNFQLVGGKYDDDDMTQEQKTVQSWNYKKFKNYTDKDVPKSTPIDVLEKSRDFLNKFSNYFSEDLIYKGLNKGISKSNKWNVKLAIEDDTYKKLLEDGELSENELEKIASSVDVKVPKKVFSKENVKAKETQALLQKLLKDVPMINIDKLQELIESIKTDFKPIEEETFLMEKTRYTKIIENLLSKDKAYETFKNKFYDISLSAIYIWDSIFDYDNRLFDEVKTGQYRYGWRGTQGEEIIERNYYVTGLKLQSDWESKLDKFIKAYVDTLKYKFIDAIIKNFSRVSKPISSFEKNYIEVGAKGFEGVYRFNFDDGSHFNFKAEAIPAGGYNIQAFHYRYITNFEDITLADGSKVKGYYSIVENFSTKKMAHGGKINKNLDMNLTESLSVSDIDNKYPNVSHQYINKQVINGIKVEMEHTKDPEVAKKIALDHLNESIFYYEELEKMEKRLERMDVDEHFEQLSEKFAEGGEIQRIPSTNSSVWGAEYKVGDKVKVRVDLRTNYEPNKVFTVEKIQVVSGAYKEDAKGNNIGGFQRPENPSGKLYILADSGGSWEGKDIEYADADKNKVEQVSVMEFDEIFHFETPTGEKSRLNYIQQVLIRTSGFKKWFGDWELAARRFINDNKENFEKHYDGVSKVIDYQTLEPKVVFHGTKTAEEFFTFDVTKEKGIGRPYAYFSYNKEYAQHFTTTSQRGESNAKPYFYQCFLSVKKPFMAIGHDFVDKDKDANSWLLAIVGQILWDKYKRINKDEFSKALETTVDSQIGRYINSVYPSDSKNKFWKLMAADSEKNFKFFLIAYGYDGVFYTEEFARDYNVDDPAQFTQAVTIFDAREVKLADGRNTQFNPFVDDIRFEKGGDVNEKSSIKTENNHIEHQNTNNMNKLESLEQMMEKGGSVYGNKKDPHDAKKGGFFEGNSHADGGIKAKNVDTGRIIEVEGNEVIINKKSVADETLREFEGEMLTNRQILSKINEEGGGVSFEDGGEVKYNCNCIGKKYNFGGELLDNNAIVNKINENNPVSVSKSYLENIMKSIYV
jgi:hypothetical protein